ncbi:FecR family protein [Roseivirga sp.]|uniref:FecR family protein n=1 Tax=Roseivirga sp. TaxID=1964215 RepID=UPI003B8E7E0B
MNEKINDSDDFLAKWLAGELSPEEEAEFLASEEGQEYLAIVGSVEKVALPAYDVERELQKLKAKQNHHVQPETKVVKLQQVFRYAAAAVIILGAFLVYRFTQPNYEVYETIAGQVETITLPDESVVTLNANSTLKYYPDKFDKNRVLELSGEAFFEVTKGINFEVITDQGTVKVLGTSFNIWNRNELLDVICYTGKVNVSEKSFTQDLTPGNGIRLNNGTYSRSLSIPQAELKPLWLTSAITTLESVTLKEALNELSNIYGIKVVSNSEQEALPYTGTFPNDDLNTAIKSVLAINNIEYSYDQISKTLVLEGT